MNLQHSEHTISSREIALTTEKYYCNVVAACSILISSYLNIYMAEISAMEKRLTLHKLNENYQRLQLPKIGESFINRYL